MQHIYNNMPKNGRYGRVTIYRDKYRSCHTRWEFNLFSKNIKIRPRVRHERYLSRYIVTLPYRPFFGISLYICCIQGIIIQQYCIYVALKLLIFNSVVYMLNSGQSYLIELYICCIQASNIGQCCIYVTFMSVILDSVVYMLHSCQSYWIVLYICYIKVNYFLREMYKLHSCQSYWIVLYICYIHVSHLIFNILVLDLGEKIMKVQLGF